MMRGVTPTPTVVVTDRVLGRLDLAVAQAEEIREQLALRASLLALRGAR